MWWNVRVPLAIGNHAVEGTESRQIASSNAAWDPPALSRDWTDYGLERTRKERVVESRKLRSKYMPGGNKESHKKNSPSGKQTSWWGPLELESRVRPQDHHSSFLWTIIYHQTKNTLQFLFWETGSPNRQQVRNVRNLKVHYPISTSSLVDPTLRQLNQIHALNSDFFSTQFNIFPPTTSKSLT